MSRTDLGWLFAGARPWVRAGNKTKRAQAGFFKQELGNYEELLDALDNSLGQRVRGSWSIHEDAASDLLSRGFSFNNWPPSRSPYLQITEAWLNQ